jgi:hypothetical protein
VQAYDGRLLQNLWKKWEKRTNPTCLSTDLPNVNCGTHAYAHARARAQTHTHTHTHTNDNISKTTHQKATLASILPGSLLRKHGGQIARSGVAGAAAVWWDNKSLENLRG